jgi:hypothetical protein
MAERDRVRPLLGRPPRRSIYGFRFKSPMLKLYQLDDLPLGVLVSVDVPLGDAQARVPR